jgi:probable phosphoglycerate mutase
MPADIGERADRIIRQIRATEGRAIVFAHGHILRVVAARWCGWPVAAGAGLALSTASVSVLGWDRETPAIKRWNT